MEPTGKTGLLTTLRERSKADTPPFFKKLRLAALVLTAIGGALVTAPVALPAALVTLGGYLALAGSVASAVSQLTVKAEEEPAKPEGNGN